jgi:small-conductance mechanosensitive channel
MNIQKLQLFQSLLVIAGYTLMFFLTRKIIHQSLKQAPLQIVRKQLVTKSIHLLLTITALVLLSGIWGFKQNEVMTFVSTILTVLGIAFFAQWSLLSNITASIILFFNHPLKLGDHIKILDKDFPIEGEIIELAYFFVHIKSDQGELITIPNAILLQKTFSITSKDPNIFI